MHQLTDLLLAATARIEHQYFQVELAGGDPIYRERVYCYELYHQLRCLWPNECDFSLNGELDKSAHPILRELGAGCAKPDLLIHRSGCMNGNNTIIEIKSSQAQRAGIKKDLETLAFFCTKIGYQRAIYLLFGYEVETIARQVRCVAEHLGELPPIELWLHSAPMQAATRNPYIKGASNG